MAAILPEVWHHAQDRGAIARIQCRPLQVSVNDGGNRELAWKGYPR